MSEFYLVIEDGRLADYLDNNFNAYTITTKDGRYLCQFDSLIEAHDRDKARRCVESELLFINYLYKFAFDKLISDWLICEIYNDDSLHFFKFISIKSSIEMDITIQAPIVEEESTLDDAFSWLRISDERSAALIVKSLELYLNRDWFNYYKIYELIKEDNMLQEVNAEFGNMMERLTLTANNYTKSGDEGRHIEGYLNDSKKSPKLSAMTLDEANKFIGELIKFWLSYRSSIG